jgi:hypothetical protein
MSALAPMRHCFSTKPDGIRLAVASACQTTSPCCLATLCARIEPDGERLGIPAREQIVPFDLGQLPGNPSRMQGGMELPHRRSRSDTHHRHPPLGVRQCLGRLLGLSINEQGKCMVGR